MIRWLLAFCFAVLSCGAALADDAHVLRIEAARLVQAAETADSGEKRQKLLREAHAKLLEFRERNPSKSTRFQLYLSGERVSLSLEDVAEMLPEQELGYSVCFLSPSVMIDSPGNDSQNCRFGLSASVYVDVDEAAAGFEGWLAGNLSAGQQQMLSIVSSPLTNPRRLLLDEPHVGLAPLSRGARWTRSAASSPSAARCFFFREAASFRPGDGGPHPRIGPGVYRLVGDRRQVRFGRRRSPAATSWSRGCPEREP